MPSAEFRVRKLEKKMMTFEQTWRWYGPNDPINLSYIEQAGATGIVTALHHIPVGEVWPVDEIEKRKKEIEWNDSTSPEKRRNLKWSVVESVNIHESIKTGASDRDTYIEKYKRTLTNLSQCGIKTVTYNFMPVLDWTRTDLGYELANGAKTLKFDMIALAAFDLYILKRKEAKTAYTYDQLEKAEEFFDHLDKKDQFKLQKTILAGLPGTDDVYSLEKFQEYLDVYKDIDEKKLRKNLAYFLKCIIPHAEKIGVKMAVHPDDPPFSILGLPRIVCKESDITRLLSVMDSPSNGLAFCTGSLGAHPENNLVKMVEQFGYRIHFYHLRSIQKQGDRSFYEVEHLGGDVDLYEIMIAAVKEQIRRKRGGGIDISIPLRSDHGLQMLYDLDKPFYPGYSAIGRLKGLAELKGMETAIRRCLFDNSERNFK